MEVPILVVYQYEWLNNKNTDMSLTSTIMDFVIFV